MSGNRPNRAKLLLSLFGHVAMLQAEQLSTRSVHTLRKVAVTNRFPKGLEELVNGLIGELVLAPLGAILVRHDVSK
jgi:energy-converting hydrogenase Eha subunit H